MGPLLQIIGFAVFAALLIYGAVTFFNNVTKNKGNKRK